MCIVRPQSATICVHRVFFENIREDKRPSPGNRGWVLFSGARGRRGLRRTECFNLWPGRGGTLNLVKKKDIPIPLDVLRNPSGPLAFYLVPFPAQVQAAWSEVVVKEHT